MLITPLPGTYRETLLQILQQLHTDAMNMRSRMTRPTEAIGAYFDWTHSAVAHLTGQIAERDIERLILTPRYWALLGSPNIGTPQYHAVLHWEINQRISDFDTASAELNAQIERWSDLATYVVPDTSFLSRRIPVRSGRLPQHPQRELDGAGPIARSDRCCRGTG